ncbi:hypothetical protein HOU02_gp217 [Caulobacter phage CcrBL9]|uniref:Uncharacterized protein n=1 Tax=Caulobacter phage CcrBL9 TaxID=2283270 RepID=A0A385EFG5_9CAUD|nr:hypothetical protein HOU02_gp217 [Caulobacter phage CcrBL9]AXQ69508.1 hypothetical protein CcrBL9_gp484 [Caulobacter phage CcrBL9]
MAKPPYRIAMIYDINGVLWHRCEKFVKIAGVSDYFPLEIGWSGVGVRQDAVFSEYEDAFRYLKRYIAASNGSYQPKVVVYFDDNGNPIPEEDL